MVSYHHWDVCGNLSKYNLCRCLACAGMCDILVCSKECSEGTVNVGHSPLFHLATAWHSSPCSQLIHQWQSDKGVISGVNFYCSSGSSIAVSWGPLSNTRSLGNPGIANTCLRTSIVRPAVVDNGICRTSGHLQKASTTTRKCFWFHSPKPTCIQSHEELGCCHGCLWLAWMLLICTCHTLQLPL